MIPLGELREALDHISEMKNDWLSINGDYIRRVAKDAFCIVRYYQSAKETIRKQGKELGKLRTRVKEQQQQIQSLRLQLWNATDTNIARKQEGS